MTLFKRVFYAALVLCLSLPVAASTTYSSIEDAAENTQDLSRVALTTIFGDVVTDPFTSSSTTVIGNLFAIFNGILAALAVVWFCVIGLRHLFNAGHQGQVFSGGRGIMGIMTTVVGFLSIVPTGSGWSLAQLMMLWASATMGVGSANLMAEKIGSDIASGYSLVGQPTSASTRTAARAIFEMELCKYAFNQVRSDLNQTATSDTAAMTESTSTAGNAYTVTVSNGSGTCGSASVPTTYSGSAWALTIDAGSSVSVSAVYAAQQTALTTMISTMSSAASTFLSTYISKRDDASGDFSDVETIIQNAASTYENTVQSAVDNIDVEDTLKSEMQDYIDKYGWLTLGAWYHTMATANQRLSEVAGLAPSVSTITHIGETGNDELFKGVMTAYKTNLQNTSYTPTAGVTTTKDDMDSENAGNAQGVFDRIFRAPGVTFTNYIATVATGTSTNPLLKMKNIGDYTMVVAETAFASYVSVSAVSSGFASSVLGKVGSAISGMPAGLKAAIDASEPAVYFLLLWMFVVSFQLSIFLPSIPFIFWMVGVGNWLVSVLVGCAAGPLWAATHLGTEQDRGSRATYGYIYFIDAMIRPALMVFGFIFASVAVVAGGTVLNALYFTALKNIQADSFTGLFSLIGFLMIYARICTTMVASIFALQAYLPDYIIAFLGGRDGVNSLGGMVDAVKGIFSSGSDNMRRTPGIGLSKMGNNNDRNKDGINK